LVTSGTATLETALFKVPEVVCYKSSWISYQIGRQLVKLKFISLVNLILNKEVVTELIQGDFNSKRITKELSSILEGPVREAQFEAYHELETKLGGSGASQNVAELIYNSLD
jgi:lipid-A-disaccharide synthase